MKDMGIVQGSEVQAKELIIGVDTVYVHTDIVKMESNIDSIYQYHEIQYTKDEYIALLANQNKELNGLINAILGVKSNE